MNKQQIYAWAGNAGATLFLLSVTLVGIALIITRFKWLSVHLNLVHGVGL